MSAAFELTAGDAVAFAVPKTAKVVDAHDIAKTTARAATEEEKWRYGVAVRIIGSRWRQQPRAPHYPAPEPYVYRKKVHSLAWQPYRIGNLTIEDEYKHWLAERDKPQEITMPKTPESPKVEAPPARLRVVVSKPAPSREASEAERRHAAAELLREIAPQYGPRRAHKLNAMADWLVATPARVARQA